MTNNSQPLSVAGRSKASEAVWVARPESSTGVVRASGATSHARRRLRASRKGDWLRVFEVPVPLSEGPLRLVGHQDLFGLDPGDGAEPPGRDGLAQLGDGPEIGIA